MKFVQISAMSGTQYSKAALWALTDTGDLYYLNFGEEKWVKQKVPDFSKIASQPSLLTEHIEVLRDMVLDMDHECKTSLAKRKAERLIAAFDGEEG